MYFDDDIPPDFHEDYLPVEELPEDNPSHIIPEEDSPFVPSFIDFQRTTFDTGINAIFQGGGSYADKITATNKLNIDPLERAKVHVAVAMDHYYDIRDHGYINSIKIMIEKFPRLEYLNIVALVGALMFYNKNKLHNKNATIKSDSLSSFYKSYPQIKPVMTIEDLLRYTRLVIKTLTK